MIVLRKLNRAAHDRAYAELGDHLRACGIIIGPSFMNDGYRFAYACRPQVMTALMALGYERDMSYTSSDGRFVMTREGALQIWVGDCEIQCGFQTQEPSPFMELHGGASVHSYLQQHAGTGECHSRAKVMAQAMERLGTWERVRTEAKTIVIGNARGDSITFRDLGKVTDYRITLKEI